MKNILRPRSFGMLILVLILAAAVYGFAAANTVPATNAGDGVGVISGYTITNVDYRLDSANPSTIDQVTFTINPTTATSIYVKLVQTGGTWFSCSNAAGSVTCNLSGSPVSASAADELRVTATD